MSHLPAATQTDILVEMAVSCTSLHLLNIDKEGKERERRHQ
jgi:hypothetical protein